MGNILVLYHSNTGNTAKMAEHVTSGASSVEGMEVRTLNVKEAKVEDLEW